MRFNYVLIKGAGDLASGVACTLKRAGFRVVMSELPQPTCVRRRVSFADAVYSGTVSVAGITGRLAPGVDEALDLAFAGDVAVLVDPEMRLLKEYPPLVYVNATMLKRNDGTAMTDAPIVIALGPGFRAGVDVHAVIETMRGEELDRQIYSGEALPDTGVPGAVGGYTRERVLRSPAEGIFREKRGIGERVQAGETVAFVGDLPVRTQISGIVRGLLKDGLPVTRGMKVGDIHPGNDPEVCSTVTDKAWAVGRGVLTAIATLQRQLPVEADVVKRSVFSRIRLLLQTNSPFLIYTLIDAGDSGLETGSRMLVYPNGWVFGTLGFYRVDHEVMDRALGMLKRHDATPEVFSADLPAGGRCRIFEEPVLPEKKLVVCGGGHIAVPLVRMAAMLGYRITVIDDRPEFAVQERFPDAAGVICAPFEEVFRTGRLAGELDANTDAVIITHSHRHDLVCLRHLIRSGVRYIGMIGSRSKVRSNFTALIAEGVSREVLGRVAAPVGLDLGGRRPEEIALSIMAEIVANTYGGSGRPMREVKGGVLV